MRDYIFRNRIDNNGLNTVSIEDRQSGNWSHRLSGGASKFFSEIKTVFKINGNAHLGESDYLLNDVMSKRRNVSFGAGFEMNNNLWEMLSWQYKANWNTSATKLANGVDYRITSSRHNVDLSFYPVDNHSFTWNNSYYLTDIPGQKNQLFIDFMYRWTVKKLKTDIEFSYINLLNNYQYIQQFNSEYSVMESYFDLRPRQFMVSTRFKF